MHLVTVLPFALVAFLGSTGVQALFRPAYATPEASYLVEYDKKVYGTPGPGAAKQFGTYFHEACVAAAFSKTSHHVLWLTAYQDINTNDTSKPWVYANCGGRLKRRDGTWDTHGPVTDLMDLAMNNTVLLGKARILYGPGGKPYAPAYPPTTKPTPETRDANATSPVPGPTPPVPGTTPPVPGTTSPVPGTTSPVPGTTPPVPVSLPTTPLTGGHGRKGQKDRKGRKGGPKRLQVTVDDTVVDFLINGQSQPLDSVDTLLGGIVFYTPHHSSLLPGFL